MAQTGKDVAPYRSGVPAGTGPDHWAEGKELLLLTSSLVIITVYAGRLMPWGARTIAGMVPSSLDGWRSTEPARSIAGVRRPTQSRLPTSLQERVGETRTRFVGAPFLRRNPGSLRAARLGGMCPAESGVRFALADSVFSHHSAEPARSWPRIGGGLDRHRAVPGTGLALRYGSRSSVLSSTDLRLTGSSGLSRGSGRRLPSRLRAEGSRCTARCTASAPRSARARCGTSLASPVCP